MSKLKVYEKKTCITCKKALAWLDEQGVDYEAADIVSNPPTQAWLEAAIDETDLKSAMNSRSAIYKEKQLGKTNLTKKELIQLMLQDPNLIKRPFMAKDNGKGFYQGFDPKTLPSFVS